MSPRSAALPMSDIPSGLKYPGKIVMMSMRTPPQGSISPGGGSMTRRPAATSTSGTMAATNGTSSSRGPAGRLDHQQVLAVVTHIGDHTHRLAADGHGGETDELMIVELVRVDRWGRARRSP